MDIKLPKRQITDRTAEIGVNIVSSIINDEFGWVFRRTHQEHDYGVDAYIDLVTEDGFVTGKHLAVQIKTGKSYLSSSGDTHWYRDSNEHLNYFLNLPTSTLLVICDPDSRECFWSCLEEDKVDFGEKNWRYPIPKNQKLNSQSTKTIKELFGEVKDHVAGFSQDHEFLKMIADKSFVMYSVTREDVEKRSIKNLKSFFARLTRNEKLTLAVQGKFCVSISGYEADPREIYQIKEVRRWAKKARKKIKSWHLCAVERPIPTTLLWLAASTSDVEATLAPKPDGRLGYNIQFKPEELISFLDDCYEGLNEASLKWGWDIDYNFEVSKAIHTEMCPHIPFPKSPNK